MERLLTSLDIQILMGLRTPKAAERLMDEWNVPFIHLGPGRGRGRRWEESAVEMAIKNRLRYPQAQDIPKKKSKDVEAERFFALSPKEAYALVHGGKRHS